MIAIRWDAEWVGTSTVNAWVEYVCSWWRILCWVFKTIWNFVTFARGIALLSEGKLGSDDRSRNFLRSIILGMIVTRDESDLLDIPHVRAPAGSNCFFSELKRWVVSLKLTERDTDENPMNNSERSLWHSGWVDCSYWLLVNFVSVHLFPCAFSERGCATVWYILLYLMVYCIYIVL